MNGSISQNKQKKTENNNYIIWIPNNKLSYIQIVQYKYIINFNSLNLRVQYLFLKLKFSQTKKTNVKGKNKFKMI